MSYFGPPIPYVNKIIFEKGNTDKDGRDQFNKTIDLVNKITSLSDSVLTDHEVDDWGTDKESGFIQGAAFFALNIAAGLDKYDLLERHSIKKTVEYIRRHFIIYSLTELHITKFYLLSSSFASSLNSNNILAATSSLRDIFEVVGVYVHFNQSSQRGRHDSISIMEKAKDILTRRTCSSRDSKEAMNDALSQYSQFDSRLGSYIYDYLCRYVHPDYFSNDVLLSFFTEDFSDLDFEEMDINGAGFTIGPDEALGAEYSPIKILFLSYQIITLAFMDALKSVFSEASLLIFLKICRSPSLDVKNRKEYDEALHSLYTELGDKYEDTDDTYNDIYHSEDIDEVNDFQKNILEDYYMEVYKAFYGFLGEKFFEKDEKESIYKSLNEEIKKFRNYKKKCEVRIS